jgi:hypothetical protein
MGNYGVITGAAAKVNLVNGTTQLALASIANEEGVRIATNQFFVDGIGNYLATVRLFPNSIGAGYTPTIQIWNATSAAVAGSRPMPVPVSYSGFYGLTVEIPFNVTNTAHAFQIRIVVPGQVRFPNICALAVEGGNIMQAIIASTAANADGGLYGSGADGDVSIPGVVTLIRDMHYNNLSLGAGRIINTAGFRVFVRGTLTMAAGAVIRHNGGNGTTGDGGGAGGITAPDGTVRGGFHSGDGSVVAGNVGGNATASGGGAGGAGGAGVNAGGAGGTATAPTPAQGGPTAANVVLSGSNAAQAALAGTSVATLIGGGAGGGGGGGNGAADSGGGGGGAGGVVVVAARNILGTGTIESNGGVGGAGSAVGNAGGGGGGGGGFVVTISNANLPATVTVQALGGAGGIGGAGGGVAGVAGAVGSTVHVKLGS